MKATWRAADAAAQTLGALRAWRQAGLLDDAAVVALASEYPAARPHLGWTWRILVFICVLVGVCTATVLAFVAFRVRHEPTAAALLLVAGLGLVALTEHLLDRYDFRPTGAEAATSLLAASYLIASVLMLAGHLHVRGPSAMRLACAWGATVFGLAAWRWGVRLYAAASGVCALVLAIWLPGGRLALLAAAALLAGAATRLLAARRLGPSHRACVEILRLVALAAIYLAVNYHSVDSGFLEEFIWEERVWSHRAGPSSLLLAGLASALYPVGLLAWGVRSRSRLLIDLGILGTALSLATLRVYFHVAPLWAVLAAAGAALVAASVLVERLLASGPNAERGGFTAAALYDEERHERLLPVAAALSLAPSARTLSEEPKGIDGGGGSFGGGGASGSF